MRPKAKERRSEMARLLLASKEPIPGGELAKIFGVSRQIIVQDIGVLKAQGYGIFSTHSGYVIHTSPLAERAIKVRHSSEQTEDELNTIVDLGGTVVDVYVCHKIYGKISAQLNIFSRLHVKQLMEGVEGDESGELMNVTGGFHYHTVRADSEEIIDNIEKALAEKGYLVELDK